MRQREIVLVCGLLGAIVLGMFTYTYMAKTTPPAVSEPVITEPTPTPLVTRIDAKHFYRDGQHTIVGEVMMPTPCDLLTYESVVQESMPEQITFAFDVINNSEMCAQVVTPQRFMVSATGSEQANLSATFDGVAIELNLVEAAPNETLEDFELYFKG